ncbi:3-deoxy-D-manno-octulosonic acid transferase [Algoriphagus mannitolivorans]|uniref:3-deoxy-D-manno-octulosonic acid transferase n=1 Tax=Algoriphagus mannitolivorans TaxID=226504 RepID=UPI001FDFDC36|nr:glycosyltransferase N-terminal domain-containing protein [Algoriphagus mannitolivorans]
MVYRLFFGVLPALLSFFSLFSKRIKHFLSGRKSIFSELQNFRNENQGTLIWVHVASLGEYEQAKPVIAKWKEKYPEHLVVVSFFSPSGFEPASRKPQANVDFITYIPLDRKSWAEEFVKIMDPQYAFFVKYDLWYHHVMALKQRGVPVYLISASFRSSQVYFSRFGRFFKNLLFQLDWIFTQNDQSVALLKEIGISRVSKAGDTRFDRVAATANSPKPLEDIKSWIGEKQVVVVGSAWQEDMDLLIPLINSKPEYKWIIAPHDLNPEPMDRWAKLLDSTSRKYSKWSPTESNSVLFIDNIGMLSSLFQFAKIAYVGGAFGKGLHNILEPLGFGVPVIFGKVKKVGKFPEAPQSRIEGCGFEVSSAEELRQVFKKLENGEFYHAAADSAKKWVNLNLGAADRIVSFIHSQK